MDKKEFKTDKNKTECGYCSKTFDRLTELENHVASHIKNEDSLIMEKDPNKMNLKEKEVFIKRIFEDDKIKEKLSEKAITKSIEDICNENNQVRESYVPEANGKIKWQVMSAGDQIEVAGAKTDEEAKQLFVYHNLRRVHEGLTLDKVKETFPPYIVEGIYRTILNDTDFFILKPIQEALTETQS